jgi:capsular polysaccharide biosynthesis protein
VKIFKHGGVKFYDSILNLDFGSTLFLKSFLQADLRKMIHAENCMPIWSHYWGSGYYDFLFFIYAKALRIASVLDGPQIRSIKIAYPVFNKSYERELWMLAGFDDDQIIDTRKYNVKADNYFLANNQSWFYPHSEDVARLQQVMKGITLGKTDNELIYVSRKGRRKLVNEKEITRILKDLNFTVIEDKQRPVVEQMAIFNNAKVIIGAHGASFANILWCRPGTHLIELFPRNYHPPYYRYLAEVLGIKYSAIFEENVGEMHFTYLGDDLYIHPQQVKKAARDIIYELLQRAS